MKHASLIMHLFLLSLLLLLFLQLGLPPMRAFAPPKPVRGVNNQSLAVVETFAAFVG
jgi:hypothetical protein